MKKMVKAVALIGFAAASAWSYQTYPEIGRMVYDSAITAESALYGFHKNTAKISDSTISFYDGGPLDAETVIMIHGYSGDKDLWLRFARHFNQDYRVIIPDLAGHGETGFNPALPHDTSSQAGRVIELMDELGIDKAHVMGNSMGGWITARLAHKQPTRLLSATLINAAGVVSPEPSDMEVMLKLNDNPFQIESREDFRNFYAMTMAKAPWTPGITLDFFAERYMNKRETLAKIFADLSAEKRMNDVINDIRVPTLVMWGAQDRLIDITAAKVWSDGIPGAKQVVYPDLGHMPMVETPEQSAKDVRAFIDTL